MTVKSKGHNLCPIYGDTYNTYGLSWYLMVSQCLGLLVQEVKALLFAQHRTRGVKLEGA